MAKLLTGSADAEFRVRSVGRSACLSVGNERAFHKRADSIEMPFGMAKGTMY